jgi:hypothetical protein
MFRRSTLGSAGHADDLSCVHTELELAKEKVRHVGATDRQPAARQPAVFNGAASPFLGGPSFWGERTNAVT